MLNPKDTSEALTAERLAGELMARGTTVQVWKTDSTPYIEARKLSTEEVDLIAWALRRAHG